MSVGSIFKVIIKDVEKAGLAIVHLIEAVPAELEKLFSVTSRLFGAGPVHAAIQLAEQAVETFLTAKTDQIITDVEHTQAFAWVKGELIALGHVDTLTEAHALAGLALVWVHKGIGIVEGTIDGAFEAATGGAAPMPVVGTTPATTAPPTLAGAPDVLLATETSTHGTE